MIEFNTLYYLDVKSLKLTKPVTTNTWVMVRVHLPTSAETSSMYVGKTTYMSISWEFKSILYSIFQLSSISLNRLFRKS